ncbi:MAG: GNAT family N-acetyltransferase [Idiomarina sp.]
MKSPAAALRLFTTALATALSVFIGTANAADFWQSGWQPPAGINGEHYDFQPLQEDNATQFFGAYQGNPEALRNRLGWGWPPVIPDEDQNAELVRFHQSQHNANKAFTYLIASRDRRDVKRLVGAVYLVPVLRERQGVPGLMASQFQAELSWWLTDAARDQAHYEHFLTGLFAWLQQEGPWQRVLIPVSRTNKPALLALENAGFSPIATDNDENVAFYQLRLSN